MEKQITYCGQKAKVACDEKCNKAWGGTVRPRFYPTLGKEHVFGFGQEYHWPGQNESLPVVDDDDYAYLPDNELGDAPDDPCTYEGGHGKPTCDAEKGNKWCVRECERCAMSMPGKFDKPLVLPDFSKPLYNIPKD